MLTKEQKAEYYRKWRARKSKDAEYRRKNCARVCAYYAAHPEKKREQWRKFIERHGTERRVAARVRNAKMVIEAGRTYSPRFYMRKPEWMPVGKIVGDTRSAFLVENATPEMREYARQLSIEMREQRERQTT